MADRRHWSDEDDLENPILEIQDNNCVPYSRRNVHFRDLICQYIQWAAAHGDPVGQYLKPVGAVSSREGVSQTTSLNLASLGKEYRWILNNCRLTIYSTTLISTTL